MNHGIEYVLLNYQTVRIGYIMENEVNMCFGSQDH